MFSRSPNMEQLNEYINGQYDDAPQKQVSHEVNIKEIQESFVNYTLNAKHTDKLLHEIASNIYEINEQNAFNTNFYPQFITTAVYSQDSEKQIIYHNDSELGKTLENLQRTNSSLKSEMSDWVLEFSKKAKITEELIGENKILRKSICDKNKQIVKLIEKIGKAENENVTELVEQLEVLKEENGVLLDHLRSVQAQIKDRKIQQKKMQSALEKARNEHLKVKKACDVLEDEQEHFSKMNTLLESSLDELTKRRKKLERERERLLKTKQRYDGDQKKLERELDMCQADQLNIETALKKPFQDSQTEKARLMGEIEEKSQQIQLQKEQMRNYTTEMGRFEQIINEHTQNNQEIERRIAEVEKAIENLRMDFKGCQQQEAGQIAEINLVTADLKLLEEELKELDEREKNQQERQKKQLRLLEEKNAKEVQQWQTALGEMQREAANRILNEKSQLVSLQRELQEWEQRIYEKKEEITDFKAQMRDIKANQNRAVELRAQLKSNHS